MPAQVGLELAALRQQPHGVQTGVADKQFVRSMVPHHAGAILMCAKAPFEDPEIKELCRKIIAGQQSEIDEMKTAERPYTIAGRSDPIVRGPRALRRTKASHLWRRPRVAVFR